MKSQATRITAFLLAALLAAPAEAQLHAPLEDPANLTGERVSPQDPADTLPIDHGAPALQQILLKLRTRASFMLIVAHPDDEDGGLLTFLSRGQGARVAMLTLNRGEGGQNFMSADFDDALGLIRTQELLAADRYMGVDQLFGTEVDFGFSKTKEEAFAKWTHDRVLYDAVRAVRLYRPLVIASVWIGGPTDGHGQHQVSGQIAQEVFNAAGDPKVFPDQIATGLEPWQPLKVYARVPSARIDAQGMFDYATNQYTPPRFTNYVTGRVTNTIPRANIVIPEGDPATYTSPDGTKTPIPGMDGLSYVQFAREGLALQKTQIGPNTRPAAPGPHDVAYTLYGSKVPCLEPMEPTPATSPNSGLLGHPSLQARASKSTADDRALAPRACSPSSLEPTIFTGIDTSLPGIATLAPEASDKLRPILQKIDAQITEAQRLFTPGKPELTVPPLRLALATLDDILRELDNPNVNDLPPDESYNLLHELRVKQVQLNNALILALGISLEATSPTPNIASDTSAIVHAKLSITSHQQVDDAHLVLFNAPGRIPATDDVSPTDTPAPFAFGKPLQRSFRADIAGTRFVTRPYFFRTDPEEASYILRNQALRNAPATPSALIVFATLKYQNLPLTIASVSSCNGQPVSHVPYISVTVTPQLSVLPNDVNAANILVDATPSGQPIRSESLTTQDGWSTTPNPTLSTLTGPITFRVQAQTPRLPTKANATVQLADGRSFDESFRPLGYPGLTYTNYYTPATTRIIPVDVTTAPNLNIAYLPGTGDGIPAALDQLAELGVHTHILTVADITTTSLKPYDAVILGVRAYEAHPELAAANIALNTYAANGGVVIAQYNTSHIPDHTGPYPLTLGHAENVVEEDAPVQILAPTDPLLTWPNHITQADFDHWIEERGHGFMTAWDPHYTALLETHDRGQAPQRGGLLIAHTGQGTWIYLGLALYRQLPEGVPGAYRLLANLISAAKNPALQK